MQSFHLTDPVGRTGRYTLVKIDPLVVIGREPARENFARKGGAEWLLSARRLPKPDCPVAAPRLPREIISRPRLSERMPMTGMGWEGGGPVLDRWSMKAALHVGR